MTEFALKSKIEQRLYIEALLHCLDRQALTPSEILKDLQDIVAQMGSSGFDIRNDILPRGEAILIAYRQGSRDKEEATDALLGLLPTNVGHPTEIAQ